MLVFDIETVPLRATMAADYPADERRPPANYKSEEAIAKWREADQEAWANGLVKEASLNPRLGRVLAVGTKVVGEEDPQIAVAVEEYQEKAILEQFWTRFRAHPAIAGYNSMAFDLPFLMVRSLVCGVAVPDLSRYLRRYSSSPHLDVRMVLGNWDSFAKGKLGEWSAFFGGPAIFGDGAEVYQLHLEGRHREIAAHCGSDIEATAFLAERVAPMVGVEVATPFTPEVPPVHVAPVRSHFATRGIAVCDSDGRVVWTGHPDRTAHPRILVYDDEGQARRALTRIYRDTLAAGVDPGPMHLAAVVVEVTHLGEPIVPRLRGEA